MYHIFFTHLSVDGHLGCFHVLASVNTAAVHDFPSCVFLILAFTGFDHIGSLAKERGIIVCNAAGYANNAVAEIGRAHV